MGSSIGTSSSSAELSPGTLVAGFRIERLIEHGSRATVYEATQLGLDRRVALKVMRDRSLAEHVRRLSWPEHPGAVSLFGAGECEQGPWLAMQLVRGGSLETARAPLDEVGSALDAAHAEGIVHGDVSARNVLVSGGRAYLSDFALTPGGSVEQDRDALAELIRDHPPPRVRLRGPARAVIAGALAAGVLGGALIAGLRPAGGESDPVDPAPPVPAGTQPIGSDLAPGQIESVDCDGNPAGGSSRACSISQRALAGEAIRVLGDGTITSWAVRGARGELSLQVLAGAGKRSIVVAESAVERVPGPEPHVAEVNLPVAAGDRIALRVAPGAAVGVRGQGPPALTERWFSPLDDLPPPRAPEERAGSGLDRELLLRVAFSPRPGVNAIEQLEGDAAAAAPTGRVLTARSVQVSGGGLRRVAVVALGEGVAIDLFDGSRRVARAPMPGAKASGRLARIAAAGASLRLRWRNADGVQIDPNYEITVDAIRPAGQTR